MSDRGDQQHKPEHTREEMVALRQHPKTWPMRPFLPLVKSDYQWGDKSGFGVLIEGFSNTLYVCLAPDAVVAMYEFGGVKTAKFKRWVKRHESYKFDSFDKILDEGWVVD